MRHALVVTIAGIIVPGNAIAVVDCPDTLVLSLDRNRLGPCAL